MAAVDPRVLCPLDPAHEVLKSRLQFHIVRCIKNHNLRNKSVCPYNAVHIVDNIDLKNHMANCPDLREIQDCYYKTDGKQLNGILSIHQINWLQAQDKAPKDEENWDDYVNTATYDPMKNSEGRPIVRTLIGAPPAQRKRFREQERRRMAKLDAELPKPVAPVKKSMEPLRLPRRLSIPSEPEQPLSLPPGEQKQPEELPSTNPFRTGLEPLRPPRHLVHSSYN